MPRKGISEELIKKINELGAQGLKPKDIAITLGVSLPTVYKYLERAKVTESSQGSDQEPSQEAPPDRSKEAKAPRGKGGGAKQGAEDAALMKALKELGKEGGEEESGAEERKMKVKDLTIEAMKMLDEGASPIEVMAKYRIDPLAMKGLLKTYREIIGMGPKESAFPAFKEMADLFGEQARDRCDHYDVERGSARLGLYRTSMSL